MTQRTPVLAQSGASAPGKPAGKKLVKTLNQPEINHKLRYRSQIPT
jgi:hypothetical protein